MKGKNILIYSAVGLTLGLIGYAISNAILKSLGKVQDTKLPLNLGKPFVCSHITAIEGGSRAENNLGNIQKLLDNDIAMIELDVQITKDGVPVLFHDETLNAKTNGSGSIKNLNWEQISGLRYKADNTQGIARLDEAIKALKKSRKSTIFQLDKCDKYEIEKINNLGLFKGVENQMLAKALSFTAPESVKKAGILYMPMIPTNYVGKMTSESVINEIVEKCKGHKFLEAQFSDADTLLINGTLAKKLKDIGCSLFIVAVPGSKNTNGVSFRGDSKKQWEKMINPMGAGGIMTNKPLALKKFINEK